MSLMKIQEEQLRYPFNLLGTTYYTNTPTSSGEIVNKNYVDSELTGTISSAIRFNDPLTLKLSENSNLVYDETNNALSVSKIKPISNSVSITKNDGTTEIITISEGSSAEQVNLYANLNIYGDIYQQGTIYETHTEQLYTKKDLIITRENAVAGLNIGEYTGIEANLYDGLNNGQLVFDKDGWGRVGDKGSLQKLATIEETPINKGITFYNSSDLQLQTNSTLTYDVSGETLSVPNIKIDKINYNIDYIETGVEPIGTRYWDSTSGTTVLKTSINNKLKDGQETRYYGKASGDILKGEWVQFAGNQGDHVLFKKIVPAEVIVNPKLLMGVANEDILNGAYGNIIKFGYVDNINTTGWLQNDILYFDNSTGQATNLTLNAPNRMIILAEVVKEETSPAAKNGIILVRISWGQKLTELEDVNGTPLTESGQMPIWDNTNGYFDFTKNINNYALISDAITYALIFG